MSADIRYSLWFAAGLASALSGQSAIPDQLENALSRVGAMGIKIQCEISYVAHVDRKSLYDRWRIGPRALRASSHEYVILGERFRFRERQIGFHTRRSGLLEQPDPNDAHAPSMPIESEIAFDGADVHIDSEDGLYSISSLESLREQRGPEANLFFPEFFDAMRITVASRPRRIGTLPTSTALRALYGGATYQYDPIDQPSPHRVTEQVDAVTQRHTWLDSSKNCGITHWEERRRGALTRKTSNSNFVDIDGIRFPRLIKTDYHSWYTAPDDISSEALLSQTVRVTLITHRVEETDLKVSKRPPGSVVLDSRYAGYGSGSEGHFAYHVPVSAGELSSAFDRATPRRPRSAGLGAWIAGHAAALLLWWCSLRFRRPRVAR